MWPGTGQSRSRFFGRFAFPGLTGTRRVTSHGVGVGGLGTRTLTTDRAPLSLPLRTSVGSGPRLNKFLIGPTSRANQVIRLWGGRRPVPRWMRSGPDTPTQPRNPHQPCSSTPHNTYVYGRLPIRGNSHKHSAVLNIITMMIRCPPRSHRNSFMILDLI